MLIASSAPSRRAAHRGSRAAAAGSAAPSGSVLPRAVNDDDRRLAEVGRDVHDIVGGALTAVRIMVERLKRSGEHDAAAINEAIHLLDVAMGDVRAVIRGLEQPEIGATDLFPALHELLATYATLGAFAGRVRRHPVESRLPPEVALALYRIAQEALTNVARHADAGYVEVEVRQRRRSIELLVTDDGRGFDADAVSFRADPSRLGLRGMSQRAGMLGGTVDVRSTPGAGTTIRVVIPLAAAPRIRAARPLDSAG